MNGEGNVPVAPSTGYTWAHRASDLTAMTLFAVLGARLAIRAAPHVGSAPWLALLAAFAGIAAADFFSGCVHWAFDTWGSVDTPVIGRYLIRTFREHHDDATAITRHDFVETNGSNSIPAVVLVLAGGSIDWTSPGAQGVFFGTMWLVASVFIAMTSQVHKWAHTANPSRGVRVLQRAGLALRKSHHDVHHRAPHERNYCITVGWLNPVLDGVRFFRTLERVITAVTRAEPAWRRHDLDASRPQGR